MLSSYCGRLRPDEFECEHAIAHLLDCCPDLDVDGDDCVYVASHCDSSPNYPILSEQDAICMQELSCDEIRRRELCEAVQERSQGAPFETEAWWICEQGSE